MKRVNYRNRILKEMVIPRLREEIRYLENRVYYNYPETKAKFPMVICNVYDSPRAYDISHNESITTIVINFYYYHEKMSSVLDLCFDVETTMIGLGFTRTQPSQPFMNGSNGKWEVTQQFRMQFNALTERLERTIQQ